MPIVTQESYLQLIDYAAKKHEQPISNNSYNLNSNKTTPIYVEVSPVFLIYNFPLRMDAPQWTIQTCLVSGWRNSAMNRIAKREWNFKQMQFFI